MTEPLQHRLVGIYLKQFDAAALALPADRRATLREEIAAHLRDATSPQMADSEVAAVADLGSPAEIIREESATPARSVATRGRRDWVKPVLVLLATASGVLGLVVIGPSAISYVWGPPGLYFSAFVWILGGLLVAACIGLFIAANRWWRRQRTATRT